MDGKSCFAMNSDEYRALGAGTQVSSAARADSSDVAELARQMMFFFPLKQGPFDEQHFAARFGPRDSRRPPWRTCEGDLS